MKKGSDFMGDKERFEISIPCDNEGFVLLQCPICGALFKLQADVFEDDSVFEVHCPECGLVSDSYITEDVLELAEIMAGNYVDDMITKELKKFERETKNSFFQIKITSNSIKKKEHPIKLTVEALERKEYKCCKRVAKIKPIIKMSGSYCPICGVQDYGIE
jgi:Zn ribbon nucleic-acid-binding protein